MIKKPIVIAIDGPAASGKGTLAKKLAQYYGLDYLDTGSIYRAVGYKIMQSDGNPEDEATAVKAAKSITDKDLQNEHLYDEGVGAYASIVSAIPAVRDVLFQFQCDFAASKKGAVLDGRDIGTVICPDADYKFYITADIEARATRRYKQLQNKGLSIIYKSVLEDLERRDARDSMREAAPLKKADDAVHIDTTNMPVEEVFEKIVNTISSSATPSARAN